MTALDSNLHLVDFTATEPNDLKVKVNQAIDQANAFLDELTVSEDTKTSNMSTQQALDDVIAFDHINLALDRSWGILSHLNSVMSNDEIRHVHHELLPKLSAYGTRVGQHQPLFSRYQAIVNDKNFCSA